MKCDQCGETRFVVEWDDIEHLWQLVCPTCLRIFRLIPTGYVEFVGIRKFGEIPEAKVER